MKITITITLLLIFHGLFAQQFSISGYVSDASNGETLIGATIIVSGTNKGTVSNVNGFFVLGGLAKGNYKLQFSHLGFEQQTVEVTIEDKNILLKEIKLHPADLSIAEVTIIEAGPDKIGDREVETSQHILTPIAIQTIPTARNDVFRALKYLPGVEASETFSPLVPVRGSDPGDNLVFMDGVVVYNPYHFLSSAGVFNMQTIKNVDLMVGGFGAEYGGRNASVLYITTKDGNNQKLTGEITPNTSTSKFFFEFPVNQNGTMMVAGRFNYDLIGNFMMGSRSYFYDMNLSYTHRFGKRNRLTVKYFASHDKTDINFNSLYRYMGNSFNLLEYMENMELMWLNRWGNQVATAYLKTVVSPRIYLRTQIYGSFHQSDNLTKFAFEFDEEDITIRQYSQSRFESKIGDLCVKSCMNYEPFYWNSLKIGAEYNLYSFDNRSTVNDIEAGSNAKKPDQIVFFAEDKINMGVLIVRPGLRMTRFNGKFNPAEPRVNATLNLPADFKIKAAWGIYYQNIISMNTQEYEFNQFLDYYYPLTTKEPSKSVHYIFGIEKAINKNNSLSADIYYKPIIRTYSFDLLQDQSQVFAFSDKIIAGEGEAYGIEFMWKGAWKNISGWASYGYSKSTRSFPHIMDGKWYLYDYDRPHSFKTVLNYQI
ncbi:MAG: TonB-dependent receptor, partial [Bacteroidota bacterium]